MNTSGNNIAINNTTIDYTIGQVFFSYSENNSYYLGEGIQQGYHNDTSNEDVDIPDNNNFLVDFKVYPNPTIDFVILSTEGLEFNNDKHSYQLYNYQGKLLANHTLKEQKTKIDLSQLSASVYILKLFVETKLWKTYKILKK